jgi:P4 family phage/plasmid primase-like protien
MTRAYTDHLSRAHREELIQASGIDPDVVAERGYVTVDRPVLTGGAVQQIPGVPGAVGTNTREILSRLGFPSWSLREAYFFPGLWIPQYAPSGTKYAGQWKPARPIRDRNGKLQKYASAKGSARLDVHPRWTHGTEVVPPIQDASLPLWITEGIKKADALTSRGCVTVALNGVFLWRNTHAALGDWEDVKLRGREIWLCFDSDAVIKPIVAKAMERLGKWLKYKGASAVWYVVVPPGVNGIAVKGADDFLAAGGTLDELKRAATEKAPKVADTSDAFTDAAMAETMSAEALDGQYIWVAGLNWLGWDGRRWREVSEVTVTETVRQWVRNRFAEAATRVRDDSDAVGEMDAWRPMLGNSRLRAVLGLAKGIVEVRADMLDSDPELLNTPSGVVNLASDTLLPHDPDLYMTKMTSGAYRPGFTHPDWDRALEVLPPEVMDWMRIRFGQAITGHTTTDDIVLILQGGGENGKGVLTTDGILPALGDYAMAASPKLFMGSKKEHTTEMADLRGQRLVIVEELTEGRSIDVNTLKRIAGVGRIRARRTHKDNVEFDTSHSIMATCNPIPVITETDHATWRRLALVRFPYTYRKPGELIRDENDRPGDPTLKLRIKAGTGGQHDAAVTWAVSGALAWFASQEAIRRADEAHGELPPDVLALPARVSADTRSWRMDADRILAFWTECLVPDPEARVPTVDMLDHFNLWLAGNTHQPWSKETFGSRFAEHEETRRHRVVKSRPWSPGKLVRRPAASVWASQQPARLPARPEVWVGVRFALPEDTGDVL